MIRRASWYPSSSASWYQKYLLALAVWYHTYLFLALILLESLPLQISLMDLILTTVVLRCIPRSERDTSITSQLSVKKRFKINVNIQNFKRSSWYERFKNEVFSFWSVFFPRVALTTVPNFQFLNKKYEQNEWQFSKLFLSCYISKCTWQLLYKFSSENILPMKQIQSEFSKYKKKTLKTSGLTPPREGTVYFPASGAGNCSQFQILKPFRRKVRMTWVKFNNNIPKLSNFKMGFIILTQNIKLIFFI